MIRPRVLAKDIYDAFNKLFLKVGLESINFIVRGLDVTLHEDPYISKYHGTELEVGMVLAIQPIF